MLSIKQLCLHLCYMLHTPVRLYDADGVPLTRGAYAEDQEDPLVCDESFAARLLAMRQSDRPVLHREHDSAVWAVIPVGGETERGSGNENGNEKGSENVSENGNGMTVLLGPFAYERSAGAVSRAVAQSHGLRRPNAYHISYLPLDFAMESILLLFHCAGGMPLAREDLVAQLMNDEDDALRTRTDAYSIIYELRETDAAHNSYAQELREQKAIREGNPQALRRSWAEAQTGQVGRLGRDELTHYRNLAVVIITLASRSAMEGGVLPEVAYSVADAYTMRVSEMSDPAKILQLFRTAELFFTELVQKSTGGESQNRYVARCRQLVHDRLHRRITVEELAGELGLSRSYLSQLFLREEGITLSAYILREKVRASEYLLMHTGYTLEQIASTYAFASQSHYGQVFKRFSGVTPGVYREQHQNRK